MTKTCVVLLAAIIAGCSYRLTSPPEDDVDATEHASPSNDTANNELVASTTGPSVPLPSPGAGLPPAPPAAPDAGTSTAPTPETPPPIAPCQGEDESEPNDDRPTVIGPNTCGTIVAGDVDKLIFDVREGNVFSLELEADASVRMEVDAPCIDATTVNGPRARVRLEPRRDCTIHLTLKSTGTTKTGWHIRRDK